MSGTRSPSRKEQAIEAVLVAHGQPSQPEAGEAHLRLLAQKVREFLPGWTVRSATLAERNSLERCLDLAGPQPLVFPIFMAEGWFTQKALAGRLKGTRARQMTALGVHPELPRLTAGYLKELAARTRWDAFGYEVLLAAHGSATGASTAQCTLRFAVGLAEDLTDARIRIGFLEEAPFLADAAARCGLKTILLPLFAGNGHHVTEDIPQALDQAGFEGLRLAPLIETPFMPKLIASALDGANRKDLAA
ncbi:CbiX/SirB N-terminal domain-containing protein [Roseibium sp. M-1]